MSDGARAVRDEDAFDVTALHAWLAARVDGLDDDLPEVRQFAGGASNLTYLLRYPSRDLVLRRPPAGRKAASAHDMRREHRVQAMLDGVINLLTSPADRPPVQGIDDDEKDASRKASDTEPFSALAFKIMTDPFVGALTFFRSLGGTIGVAALGAVLASSVIDRIATALGTSGGTGSTGSTLDLSGLPAPVVETIRAAYADSTAEVFMIAGLVALVTLVAVVLMPVSELRTTIRKTEPQEADRPVEDALV